MSNVNTFAGFYNLPTQVITTGTTATAILVPASGTISTLPSPSLPVGSNIFLSITDSVLGNMTVDGHQFKVRVSGKVNLGATGTFTPSFNLGGATAFTTSLAGVASASVTGPLATNFVLETTFLWDSVSQKLTGYSTQLVNGVVTSSNVAATGATAIASATAISVVPTFAFSVANAANSVTIAEFVFDR